MYQSFIAPNIQPFFLDVASLLLPGILKVTGNIDDVLISEEDQQTLRSMKGRRLIFFSNHPTSEEPFIAFKAMNLTQDHAYYLASRHVFDNLGGLLGQVLSWGGVFSVIPGAQDRASVKMVRQVLAKPHGKLVLFPEGEPLSGENEQLLPFQKGLAQLAFWGYEEARKKDQHADITILPSYIKYTITGNERLKKEKLSILLADIERKLQINAGDKNLLRRTLTCGRKLLEQQEAAYGISDQTNSDFDFRLGKLRHAILDKVAAGFAIPIIDQGDSAIIKLRKIWTTFELLELRHPSVKDLEVDVAKLKQETILAYNFIVLQPDYIITYPSAERLFEWILIYETILAQRESRAVALQPSHLPRKAHLSLAQPFLLSEYYADYKANRAGGIDKVMNRVQGQMQQLLVNALGLSPTIVQPFDLGKEKRTV